MKSYSSIFLALMLGACSSVPEPQPFGPLPSEAQVKWQELETYGFVHFNMNTFTDIEWGNGDADPSTFNPTQLDCKQWAKVCKEAGLKGIILTAKHHDGFCLWPSAYTEYSVKNSKWRDGKGDVVRELSEACKEYGLKFGVYLSPWDRNHAEYGRPEYITYFRNQMTELLTNYGEVYEVWCDGANGGSGYYGGANETRSVDRKNYYGWDETNALIHKLQPNAVVFSDAGPGCRWCGDEEGWVGETNWSLLRRDEVWPGYPKYEELRYGHEDGTHWVPAEVDVSIRPGWFYHEYEDHKVKSLQQMVDIYYHSVGRNGVMLLNFPVDKRGLIHENDVKRLQEFSQVLKEDFKENIALDKDVTASNVRGNASKYEAENLTDDDPSTYWSTDDNVLSASFEIELGKEEVEFNRILLQENIRLGQRVKAFTVEYYANGKWNLIDKQTTIGYKRILRFPKVKGSKVRVNIDAKACPVITNVEVFNAPKLLVDPTIVRNKEGQVTITGGDEDAVIKYSVDGSEPNKVYSAPFMTNGKTVVKAVVVDETANRASAVVTKNFDVLHKDWKVVGCKGNEGNEIFDGDKNTVWFVRGNKMPVSMTMDMGKVENVKGFQYLPDQNRWSSGIIFDYVLSVSKDGRNWKEVSKGEFSNINNHPIMQTINFDATPARFIKVTALRSTDNSTSAGFAEVDVITE